MGPPAAAISATPGAMQLRTLQTLAEIATEHNSTIVFPLGMIEALSPMIVPRS